MYCLDALNNVYRIKVSPDIVFILKTKSLFVITGLLVHLNLQALSTEELLACMQVLILHAVPFMVDHSLRFYEVLSTTSRMDTLTSGSNWTCLLPFAELLISSSEGIGWAAVAVRTLPDSATVNMF